jgi:hypothetical protein
MLFYSDPAESIGIMDPNFMSIDAPSVRMTFAWPLSIFDTYLDPRW